MIYKLPFTESILATSHITIPGSKSETNRLLLLQALFPQISLQNVSDSDDSLVMKDALYTNSKNIDIGHAGTAMRFLTAYFAVKKNSVVTLTGSHRMKKRPIKVLVDALQVLGATISYKETYGFPPLEIEGALLKGGEVTLPASVSSQYVSALMLVGATLQQGITLQLEGNITSRPYIEMTQSLLEKVGISSVFIDKTIIIQPQDQLVPIDIVVESDWSAASYFYSIVALSKNTSITLHSFINNSIQGDTALVTIYEKLGVTTLFNKDGSITLSNKKSSTRNDLHQNLLLDLNNTPDIAQTIVVTCFGLGVSCDLFGLHTLKIKETDRLRALKNELEKLGGSVSISEDSLHLKSSVTIKKDICIETYDDHRMAMAFAPLCLKVPIQIKDPLVVSKSFPGYWEALKTLGITKS